MHDYTKYMELCENLARSAFSKGNSAVGSLILLNNEIVAKSEEAVTTKQDVSCHAEMEVIREARKIIGKDMSGAILISTKEPCVMCSYAIRYHKISYVVYKEKIEKLGGFHGDFNLLSSDLVPINWGAPVICLELKP